MQLEEGRALVWLWLALGLHGAPSLLGAEGKGGSCVPSVSPEKDRSHPSSDQTSSLDPRGSTLLKTKKSGFTPKWEKFSSSSERVVWLKILYHDVLLLCIIAGPGPSGSQDPVTDPLYCTPPYQPWPYLSQVQPSPKGFLLICHPPPPSTPPTRSAYFQRCQPIVIIAFHLSWSFTFSSLMLEIFNPLFT